MITAFPKFMKRNVNAFSPPESISRQRFAEHLVVSPVKRSAMVVDLCIAFCRLMQLTIAVIAIQFEVEYFYWSWFSVF